MDPNGRASNHHVEMRLTVRVPPMPLKGIGAEMSARERWRETVAIPAVPSQKGTSHSKEAVVPATSKPKPSIVRLDPPDAYALQVAPPPTLLMVMPHCRSVQPSLSSTDVTASGVWII
eukprot:1643497-Rhodomonas_salina.1